ncbi:MAG: hypothetical protein CRN43_18010 [Candidatus Nephrothrix sp. EaCA]|nr:MAG: hypothetical protein CRN43_18010 [Candidatus Nephrothrix sp. EaCA]
MPRRGYANLTADTKTLTHKYMITLHLIFPPFGSRRRKFHEFFMNAPFASAPSMLAHGLFKRLPYLFFGSKLAL